MTKIEELNPNYETALGCLRYTLMCLEKNDVSNAKHAVRDALSGMGFKDSDVYPYRQTYIPYFARNCISFFGMFVK